MTTRKIRPRPRCAAYVSINEPRPDASKIVAAKQRAGRPAHDTEPITPLRRDAPILRRQLLVPIGVVGCVLVGAILFTRLPSVPAPQALHITPSSVATATSTPVRNEPTQEPTVRPIASPVPAQPATGQIQEPPIGRGLTIDVAPAEPTAAPTYIDNVAAQAPHSPRGGYCGPTGGDCAPGVPVGIDNSAYIDNVAAQAPHKVR